MRIPNWDQRLERADHVKFTGGDALYAGVAIEKGGEAIPAEQETPAPEPEPSAKKRDMIMLGAPIQEAAPQTAPETDFSGPVSLFGLAPVDLSRSMRNGVLAGGALSAVGFGYQILAQGAMAPMAQMASLLAF